MPDINTSDLDEWAHSFLTDANQVLIGIVHPDVVKGRRHAHGVLRNEVARGIRVLRDRMGEAWAEGKCGVTPFQAGEGKGMFMYTAHVYWEPKDA